MIVQELGESDENLNSIISTPLLATETEFAKKLENDFLKNTFIQLTMKISTIHYNNKQSKEDNKNLTNIIKNKDLENITAATKEGLNNTNILESRETLENFLQERDKVLERKLFSKFIQQQKQKKLKWLPQTNPKNKNYTRGKRQHSRVKIKKFLKSKKELEQLFAIQTTTN